MLPSSLISMKRRLGPFPLSLVAAQRWPGGRLVGHVVQVRLAAVAADVLAFLHAAHGGFRELFGEYLQGMLTFNETSEKSTVF